ncbi:MAG: family 10 glycosylhydrolase [Bacilli bacterium]|nr:family 10 glycosylhydrolase [Bacilli bacterium]
MIFLKKTMIFSIALLIMLVVTFPSSNALTLVSIPKTYDAGGGTPTGNVVYRGSSIEVKVPDTYVEEDAQFRAVWVTPHVNDIAKFQSTLQYKAEISKVIQIMKYFNLNVMIYHVRALNDAFYESELNPWTSYLKGFNVDPGWDPLPWIIEECHRNGIEFHAWLNPYRVRAAGATLEQIATLYQDYPNNPASNVANMLAGDTTIILNPGLPNVRTFLVNTCMEIVENYDVDAIHFDDYFYTSAVDDSATFAANNPGGLTISNWRREQINIFIQNLYNALNNYNSTNNKFVQLGISPTGVYRNVNSYAASLSGTYDINGNYSGVGTYTVSQEHYESYLYADTKKWIEEEWIDYILPQTYWSIEHDKAPYADIISWWNKVVENKDVNLYSGIGLYYNRLPSAGFSWATNPEEVVNQFKIMSTLDNVSGFSIFSFQNLRNIYEEKAIAIMQQQGEAMMTALTKPAIQPSLKSFSPVVINTPISNLGIYTVDGGYVLKWNKMSNAAKYVIYRNEETLGVPGDNVVVGVVGNTELESEVKFFDNITHGPKYNYTVVPVSHTNSLGSNNSTNTNQAIIDTTISSLGDIENVYYNGAEGFDKTVRIFWNEKTNVLGGEVSYEVFYSSNQTSWQNITTTIGKISYLCFMDVVLPKNYEAYYKIRVYNNLGESYSDPLEIVIMERSEMVFYVMDIIIEVKDEFFLDIIK